MSDQKKNYFSELYAINTNEHTEKKNGLTYLSWAWAWAEVKKLHPDAFYTIYENKDGWFYHTDGKTCWVKTGVTIEGIEHIEYLPVMDYRNQSIALSKVTSFDVNKAIQRSLTKACARHGLGLYIYAGEDLPEPEDGAADPIPAAPPEDDMYKPTHRCESCGSPLLPYKDKNGIEISVERHIAQSQKKFGKTLCLSCIQFEKSRQEKLKEINNA